MDKKTASLRMRYPDQNIIILVSLIIFAKIKLSIDINAHDALDIRPFYIRYPAEYPVAGNTSRPSIVHSEGIHINLTIINLG